MDCSTNTASRRHFRSEMRRLCLEKEPGEFKEIRRSWFFGEPEFKSFLLEEFEGKAGESHQPEDRREQAEQKGERLIREGLKKLRWKESDLLTRRKGDPAKVKIAMKLREETTLTLKWIAERLVM